MRILLVTHYFPPETGAPQARLSALASAWAADGDEVTVLTGMPNHPTGVIPAQYRGAIRRRERQDGYRVVRTWLYATPNEGVARKTIGHLSFMLTSVLLGGRASGPADVVVVSSPTFFSIGAGWLLARLKRARLVVEVRDLWPAIFTELGVLTSRPLIRLLERLELAAYAAADTVIVVSDGFRANLLARGVPAAKVHTIRNGVRPGDFDPGAPADPGLRARLGADPGDTLVLYAGTHGISQGLTTVAEAAAQLTGQPVRFAFVGEGADKQRRAGRRGPRAGRRSGPAAGDGAARALLRGEALRPGGAGRAVPQAPRLARRPAMRLLVLGGSGFLGGYLLREAARRGHQAVALARSPAAARTVAARGARPLAGDLDDACRLDEAFAAAGCEALVCLARWASATARPSSPPPRRPACAGPCLSPPPR